MTVKGVSVFSQPIVCVDIETDGMNHVRGHIIEVAVIRIEHGVIVDEFTSLVNPQTEIPYFITKLTGITSGHVQDAPTFDLIATRLQEIMTGALFVAHNVRFDYSFLKQEFRRVGIDFDPQQLCTVKLSRALYPEQKSHKLASLIERHGFTYSARHRAYDDAHVLWQFLSLINASFPLDHLSAMISRQIKQPSLPKHLRSEDIAALPTGPGVYIFQDEQGAPLYIGKSVNIKRRVQSHFTRDSEEYREFKIAQSTHAIVAQETGGELEALLLESHLIKTQQPLYNRLLRRSHKLLVAKQYTAEDGYLHVHLDSLDTVSPDDFSDTLALYTKRSTAKESLLRTIKTFDLCPKLCGIEKAKSACFSYQLRKCKGACIGKEDAVSYNRRLLMAFEHKRIDAWPFLTPMLIQEHGAGITPSRGFIVDQWCIIGAIEQDEGCEPRISRYEQLFDMDAYKILRSFIIGRPQQLTITPYTPADLF